MHARFFFSLSFIVLTSCSVWSKYSAVEYNNLIVNSIDESSAAIEETATLYNASIPDVVTEEEQIELSEMEKSYENALAHLKKTENLLTLESRNLEQQNAVGTELKTYQSAGKLYLETFAEMLDYYSSGAYQEDITQVEPLDEKLHTDYTTFIEANNDLVDVLESFVAETGI